MTALTAGSIFSIRPMQLSMSSTGESLRSPINARAATAGRSHGSVISAYSSLIPAACASSFIAAVSFAMNPAQSE